MLEQHFVEFGSLEQIAHKVVEVATHLYVAQEFYEGCPTSRGSSWSNHWAPAIV